MKAYHLMGKAPYFTNCFMLTDNAGNAVLIDCSADVETVQAILDNDRAQLKAILLTHGHADHRETLEETVARYGCPVYLGSEDARLFGLEGTTPYEDGTVMKLGEIKFYVFSTPGHTPGGFCLWAEGLLFTGDTLFAGTVGRTDMRGGDFEVLKQSLKKILATVDENPQVLPGHNHFSTMEQEKAQNPYLKSVR